jgi:hypothetical protein
MPSEHRQSSSTAGRSSLRYLVLGALVTLLAACVGLLVVGRDGSATSTSSSDTSPSETTIDSSPTTIPNSRGEVVARLREILQIREQAFRERNASLFEDVYTSDCSCLEAGRKAIAALRKENVQWSDRSVSIDVQSAKSIGNDLWEVVAVFVSDAFRIETEEGVLVREAPAERLRYRFLLVRASEAESWRLGKASLIQD